MHKKEYDVWYECNDFPNYQINKMGQIRNKSSKKLLKGSLNRFGYLTYTLRKNGKNHFQFAHVLVAKQFIPNPNGYTVVNHIDEDKVNCCIDNLEWVSIKSNSIHGTAQDRRARQLEKPISEYALDGTYIRTWRSTKAIVEYLQGENIDNTKDNKLYSNLIRIINHNSKGSDLLKFGNRIFMKYKGCENISVTLKPNQQNPRKYKYVIDILIDNMVVPKTYLFNPNEKTDSHILVLQNMLHSSKITSQQSDAIKYALYCINAINNIEHILKDHLPLI